MSFLSMALLKQGNKTLLHKYVKEFVNKKLKHSLGGVSLLSIGLRSLSTQGIQRRYSSEGTVSSNVTTYDVIIVGAGIVGLATARELKKRFPRISCAVVEKEEVVAKHQSGRNSGVIHAGIYYTPGSLKAKLCVEGLKLMYEYLDANSIPYRKCGKLIVATDDVEVPRLINLFERATQNKVPEIRLIDGKDIPEIEPNCQGLKALHSPITGIVDFANVTRSFGSSFQEMGGKMFLNFAVSGFGLAAEGTPYSIDSDYPVTVISSEKVLQCRHVLTCAGLQSDRIARLSGCDPLPQIVPFRGDYLLLKTERADLVRGNIYPVPNPKFPFLGFHFTPRMDGNVWLGPNAVLSLKREGYGRFDVNMRDAFDAISFRGLQRLVLSNLSFSLQEFYRGLRLSSTVNQLRKFVPSLRVEDVVRGPSGVRAQALDASGELVDDFVFDGGSGDLGGRMLHVRNAPSPACTSSIAIARMIIDKADEKFKLTKLEERLNNRVD